VAADLARNRNVAVGGAFVPSAVDNMSPRHPFIRALQEIPVAPSVKAHSIIAVEGDGPVETGDDGVVKYSSAHIEGVESELIVRSSHSAQGNPHTIQEVRRILRLHVDLEPGAEPLEP
jgi:transposase InsO family protein